MMSHYEIQVATVSGNEMLYLLKPDPIWFDKLEITEDSETTTTKLVRLSERTQQEVLLVSGTPK